VNFWAAGTATYVEGIDAIMVSFAEIVSRKWKSTRDNPADLKGHLGFNGEVFLDNGCYTLLRKGQEPSVKDYVRFIKEAKPDWFPVPIDYVPSPSSSLREARQLAERTARMNEEYGPLGFVPVVHIGPHFMKFFELTVRTLSPSRIAIGGIVPYVQYSRGAKTRFPLELLAKARRSFGGQLHIFGFGGGITSLHIAAALSIDSTDSCSWRVRAARGLIMVPGRGERAVRDFRSRKDRILSLEDLLALKKCRCAPCKVDGINALEMTGQPGFQHRAIHNLSVLSHESKLLNEHRGRNLKAWSLSRLNNSQRRFLLEYAFKLAEV